MIALNFVKEKKCEGTTLELFNSRAWEEENVDIGGYHSNGNDDTRVDCFRECIEYFLDYVEKDENLQRNCTVRCLHCLQVLII